MGDMVTCGGPDEPVTALVERAASTEAPVVVLLHSWWGLTDHFRQLSLRLSGAGFTVVAPDLYNGQRTDDPDRARDLRRALSTQAAMAAGLAALQQASQLATAGRIGVLGFSMGAELGIRLAVAQPDDVAAVVAFYGVCVPEGLVALSAPVQAHVATNDEFATAAEIGEFTEHLVALGKPFELNSYPDTQHGFFNRSLVHAYHPDAAELAWRRTLEFLRRTLDGRTVPG